MFRLLTPNEAEEVHKGFWESCTIDGYNSVPIASAILEELALHHDRKYVSRNNYQEGQDDLHVQCKGVKCRGYVCRGIESYPQIFLCQTADQCFENICQKYDGKQQAKIFPSWRRQFRSL